MNILPKIPNEVMKKVRKYIRNKIDISSLIAPYDIQGQDFTGAIIKNINRSNQDLSNTNFTKCIIGEEGKVTNLCNNNFSNGSFAYARLLGKVWMRRCKCRNVNFTSTYMPYLDYQYTDFTNSDFCEVVIQLGTSAGLGAEFDDKFFKDLSKSWKIKIEKVND